MHSSHSSSVEEEELAVVESDSLLGCDFIMSLKGDLGRSISGFGCFPCLGLFGNDFCGDDFCGDDSGVDLPRH